MTFEQAIGIKCSNIDTVTGKKVEFYENMIEC